MPNWNTEKIMKDLKEIIPNFKEIKNLGQSNDYDTDNIVITFNTTKDSLYLCGFTPKVRCDNPDNAEVDYVEVTDDLDNDEGGLNSKNEQIAQAFLLAKQYLRSKKFVVANKMDDFFE
jgi:hypothetical protein